MTFVEVLRLHAERVRRRAWSPGAYLRLYPWLSACGPVAYMFDRTKHREPEKILFPADTDLETDWELFDGALDPLETTIPKTFEASLVELTTLR